MQTQGGVSKPHHRHPPPRKSWIFPENPGARRRQALLLQKNKRFIRFLFWWWWWWVLGPPLVILRGVLPALRLRMSPGDARATGLGCRSLNTSRLLARQAGLDHSGLSDSCFDNFSLAWCKALVGS